MKYLRRDHLRLADFLAIIMAMSVVFSGILYGIAAQQLEHQARPGQFSRLLPSDDIYQEIQGKVQGVRMALALQLIGINVVMLILGALEPMLAEKALEPIEANMRAQGQIYFGREPRASHTDHCHKDRQ